jgi:hypothetical protein
MATGPGVNQGKTAFLEEFLPDNRDADLAAVNRAWNAAGNQGTISESLHGKIRSKLGLTGRRGTNGGATEEKAGPSAKTRTKTSPKGAKSTSKTEEAPPQSNGREGDTGPSKSAFVEEVLGREPKSNVAAINRAWAAAGHEGTISDSIYYKVKRERGVTGGPAVVGSSDGAAESGSSPKNGKALPAVSKSKSSPKASKPERVASTVEAAPSLSNREPAAPKPTPTMTERANGHGRELHEIEGEIDELMFRLKGLGGFAEVQEALRSARRLLVRSHEA